MKKSRRQWDFGFNITVDYLIRTHIPSVYAMKFYRIKRTINLYLKTIVTKIALHVVLSKIPVVKRLQTRHPERGEVKRSVLKVLTLIWKMILVHTNAFLFLILWKQYSPSFKNITGPHICFYSFAVQKHSETFAKNRGKGSKDGSYVPSKLHVCYCWIPSLFPPQFLKKRLSTCQHIPGAWTSLVIFLTKET